MSLNYIKNFYKGCRAQSLLLQPVQTHNTSVVTGASEGIGRAYAFALAEQGMNVVIMSRTKATLDQVAKEISDATGQRVKVVVTDFTKENVFSEIEDQLKDLNIGVLVNNVGMLPSIIPCKFLESTELDQTIIKVINCNVKTTVKMCKIILPGMENRGKGVIVNISSGVASIPCPMYSLYSASKVFVERFSQGLQAEYKDKGIIIQAVAPFGVSTRMAGFQQTNIVTLSPEDFVKSSLHHLRAGDKTYGSVCHTVLNSPVPSEMEETFDQMNTPPDDLVVSSVTTLISTKPVGAEEN
ncbi:-beta-hydroxysteroid dehydrogenase type 3 [Scomber scombrus]|uniref:-beta-hydroxysteroid dehydrogenase type 3 n=1 Tax=Scomber scombrus TaxID=13677 RepID=A0AAV1MV30_SCOSC